MKYWLFIVLGTVIISSCEKPIPFDSEGFNPKLVINSFNSSDSAMNISVSASTRTLSTPSRYGLSGKCKVLLLKDNLLLVSDNLDLINGKLKLPYRASLGSRYELQLSFGSYPAIKATDIVPDDVPLLSLDTFIENTIYYTFKVKVQDSPGDSKYQFQVVMHGKELVRLDSVPTSYKIPFSSTNKLFLSNIRTVAGGNSFALFNDELWQDQKRDIEIRVSKTEVFKQDFTPESIEIKLTCLSTNMYEYYVALLQNNHVYGGPLSSVTDLNGNIEQGLGGFYFYTQTSQSVDL